MHLVECNWISSLCADRAETSYKSFIKTNDVKERMKAFTLDLIIDTLYLELLKTYIELREVVKIVLIFSHGNAHVEAAVSINGDITENMSEEALVAHRIVYDGVVNNGGLENVKVDKEMMKYVDKALSQYLHHLKTSIENQTIAEKKKAEKRKLSYDIKKANEAKQKCTEQLQRKAAEYDSQILHLEEQLRKQCFFSNFSVSNIVFIFLGKVKVVLRYFYRYRFLFFRSKTIWYTRFLIKVLNQVCDVFQGLYFSPQQLAYLCINA